MDDLLHEPGTQDLAAQVNFTVVQSAGEAEGLRTEAMTSQSQFLDGIVATTIREAEVFGPWDATRTRSWRTLSHPGQMGHAFRVLIQSK